MRKKKYILKIAPVSLDKHFHKLLKDSKFKKEYLKELKRLRQLMDFYRKEEYQNAIFNEEISKCCGVYAVTMGKVTMYNICTKCKKPCDIIREEQ